MKRQQRQRERERAKCQERTCEHIIRAQQFSFSYSAYNRDLSVCVCIVVCNVRNHARIYIGDGTSDK